MIDLLCRGVQLILVSYWVIWKIKFWENDRSEGLMKIVKA